MSNRRTRFLLGAALLAASMLQACAAPDRTAEPARPTERFFHDRHWSAFADQRLTGSNCWVATTPIQKTGILNDARLLIMMKAGSEVDFTVHDGNEVLNEIKHGVLSVDGKEFRLIIIKNKLWLHDEAADPEVLRALTRAEYAQLHFGEDNVVTFSTEGFGRAFNAASQACA